MVATDEKRLFHDRIRSAETAENPMLDSLICGMAKDISGKNQSRLNPMLFKESNNVFAVNRRGIADRQRKCQPIDFRFGMNNRQNEMLFVSSEKSNQPPEIPGSNGIEMSEPSQLNETERRHDFDRLEIITKPDKAELPVVGNPSDQMRKTLTDILIVILGKRPPPITDNLRFIDQSNAIAHHHTPSPSRRHVMRGIETGRRDIRPPTSR